MAALKEPYVAVFDIETTATLNDTPGNSRDSKCDALPVSCASVLCVSSRLSSDPQRAEEAIEQTKMITFWRDVEGRPGMDKLIEVLEGAELIVGYNIFGFDFPVIRKYYKNKGQYRDHVLKSLDVFVRVKEISGYWPKLDALLAVNRMACKTSSGLEAINMWRENRLDELQTYCEGDVRQTARLALQKTLRVDHQLVLPNHVFGVASKLAAMHHCDALP